VNDEQRRSIAIEEIKLLSSIIGRIESTIYQRHAWLFTLITGLTLALFKDSPLICKQQFFVLSASITIVFWITDAIQRVPVHRAIERSKAVEESLRNGKEPGSPLISASLSGKSCKDSFKDFMHTAFRFRILTPYLATLAVVGIIWCIAP
jgi:hypothetical protein